MVTLIRENRLAGFSLVEVMLAISVIILVYIGATTAQISSEIFLKNLRQDFEIHLEANNAMDHMINNIRRSYYVGGSDKYLEMRIRDINNDGIIDDTLVTYMERGNDIVCNIELRPIAHYKKGKYEVKFGVNFIPPSVSGVKEIQIVATPIDPEELKFKPMPIVVISKAYARDK